MTQIHGKGPASAGLFRVLVALLAVVAGACAVGGGDKDEGGFPDDKGAPARPLDPSSDATTVTMPDATSPGGGTSAATPRPGAAPTPGAGPAGPGSGTPTTVVPYVARLEVADRTGDAGLQSKPYGDVVRLRLDDNGTRARFTVEMAAAFPTPLPADEQVHLGLDLFRGSDGESEFQLFGEGNSDGWRAWLQGPKGFVEYPGTFEMGGNRLVFTVPWSALGGRRPGSLRVLAEWDKARLAVLADSSSDRAPEGGPAPFTL